MTFLDVDALQCALVNCGPYTRFEVVDSTGSTNTDVLEWQPQHPSDSQEGLELQALCARHQRAGRGRLDRRWLSPRDKQLICSLLVIPPQRCHQDLGLLPLVAGVAIVTVLGAPAELKWPNDVLLRGKKVCGILAQARFDPLRIAVGFGINLTVTPEELPGVQATSLAAEGLDHDSTRLAIDTLRGCAQLITQWSRGGRHLDDLLEQYRGCCSTVGKRVRVDMSTAQAERVITGLATGVSRTGELIVDTPEGTQSFSAGDVTHLRLGDIQ